MTQSQSVEEYIGKFEGDVKARLERMRELVRAGAPEAEESVSYGLVGYKQNGKPLVYFGGFKSHIGFYATPNGHEKFAQEFSRYVQGKGSVQLPLDEPLPDDLVRRVIKYRLTQI